MEYVSLLYSKRLPCNIKSYFRQNTKNDFTKIVVLISAYTALRVKTQGIFIKNVCKI